MFIATRWFSTQARKAFSPGATADWQRQCGLAGKASRPCAKSRLSAAADENIRISVKIMQANRDAKHPRPGFYGCPGPVLEGLSYASLAIVAGVGGLLMLNGRGLMGTSISVGLIITFIGCQPAVQPAGAANIDAVGLIQSAIAGAGAFSDLSTNQLRLSTVPMPS